MPETEKVDLPDAVVVGWAVNKFRAVGTEGEEHALDALTLIFQVSEGHEARQTFIMHKKDAAKLRADLKNPPPFPTPKQENPES